MLIRKIEYEKLKSVAENNEHDAKMFRDLIKYIKEKKTVIHNDFVIISFDVWNELSNKWQSGEDNLKDTQAELEWYKVKYIDYKEIVKKLWTYICIIDDEKATYEELAGAIGLTDDELPMCRRLEK